MVAGRAHAMWASRPGYHDIGGNWVSASPEAVNRVLTVMGADGDEPPSAPAARRHEGDPRPLHEPAEIVTEDGAVLPVRDALPAWLRPATTRCAACAPEDELRLIVSPEHCHLPEGLRAWGWAAQLYGLRSPDELGGWATSRISGTWPAGRAAPARRPARCW